MSYTQEFLVLESGDALAVYGVRDFPRGTIVSPEAKRLRIVGPSWVQLPQSRFSVAELNAWRRELARDGYTTAVEPFWRRGTTAAAPDRLAEKES